MNENEKFKIPKCFKGKVSLKKQIIDTLQAYIDTINSNEIEGCQDNNLRCILLTSMGIIEADIRESIKTVNSMFSEISETELSFNPSYIPVNALNTFAEFENDTNKEFECIDNPATIYLENVKLTTNQGATSDLPHLIVFADQIIGFTIVNRGTGEA